MTEVNISMLEKKILSMYGYKKSLMFEDDLKNLAKKYSEKFEYITSVSEEYLKEGLHVFFLIKKNLKTNKKEFSYGKAKAIIKDNILEISGYLDAIEYFMYKID